MWSLFKIAPQCCDAFTYVQQGNTCALTGACSGDIRPMGVYYWFSIPERLGLPLNVLILLNLLLMLASVVLSVFALQRTLQTQCPHRKWGPITGLAVLVASLLAHGVFLYPTLFHTLTDGPSSCLALMGAWLMLMSLQAGTAKQRGRQLFAAGLLWGFAAWLRAFYLYPVLCGLAIYLLGWVCSRPRQWCGLLLLSALLPIGTQYLHTYQSTGKLAYLDEEAGKFITMHSSLTTAGYDTLLPSDGFFYPPDCVVRYGILDGLKAGAFDDVACLAKERLKFYLGSYQPETYVFTDVINQLEPRYVELQGDPVGWWLDRMSIDVNAAPAPDGSDTAERLTLLDPSAGGQIFKPVMLRGDTTHTFSVWLWSPTAMTLDLVFTRNYDRETIASSHVTISPEPQRYTITGRTTELPGFLPADASMETMQYAVSIRSQAQASDKAAFFYVWGGQLEAADHASTYQPYKEPALSDIRVLKPWLWYLQLSALLLALLSALAHWRIFLASAPGLAIMAAFGLALVESLAIIPEQRFSVAWQILLWWLVVLLLLRLAPAANEERDQSVEQGHNRQ